MEVGTTTHPRLRTRRCLPSWFGRVGVTWRNFGLARNSKFSGHMTKLGCLSTTIATTTVHQQETRQVGDRVDGWMCNHQRGGVKPRNARRVGAKGVPSNFLFCFI